MRRPLALFLLLTACDGQIGGPVCTEIGCTDQLVIQFQTPDGGDVVTDLVATIDTGTESYSVDCVNEGDTELVDCADAIVRIPEAPDTVTVSATSAEGTFDGDLTPSYEVFTPNGEECPPECLQDTVPVAVVAR